MKLISVARKLVGALGAGEGGREKEEREGGRKKRGGEGGREEKAESERG